MKIKVSALEHPRHEEELYVYSLSYDCATGSFWMPAGGYFIKPDREYRPVRLHGQWDTLFIKFKEKGEAQAFCQWLREANSRAVDSFNRMLD